jgi:ribonucleoside-diphosphate reductase alpha chain
MVGKIYSTLRDASYEESIIMAGERGPFPVWDWEKEKNNAFIKRLPLKLRKQISAAGRRNISNLTNAPTGSVAICAFNSSSGIEPVFRNVYTRRKKISHNEEGARVDFIDDMGDKWQEFNVFHHNVVEWVKHNDSDWDGQALPDLPDFFVSADEIDWEKRVELQGAAQKNIDHSISSTINLAEETPTVTIGKIYLKAWEAGLKGVTVYREGSRSGVLVSGQNGLDAEGRPRIVKQTQAPRRPLVLSCDIYHGRVQGELWTILVGLLRGRPYELFGGPSEDAGIPKSAKTGYLTKIKVGKNKNRYNLTYNHYNEAVVVEDIGNIFENKTYGTFTRILSLSLRHGAPVQHIVEQLRKDKSEELNSLSAVLGRALKKYIEDGTVVACGKEGCEKCGSTTLRYQEGCPVCLTCGFTKCK